MEARTIIVYIAALASVVAMAYADPEPKPEPIIGGLLNSVLGGR
uniref:Uncharacterized protein n=1 Tax=Tetranychus urticae TaxID=32264 RepID=T1K0N6_TETUR